MTLHFMNLQILHRNGDSNHILNFILSTYWNNKVYWRNVLLKVYIFLTNRNLPLYV